MSKPEEKENDYVVEEKITDQEWATYSDPDKKYYAENYPAIVPESVDLENVLGEKKPEEEEGEKTAKKKDPPETELEGLKGAKIIGPDGKERSADNFVSEMERKMSEKYEAKLSEMNNKISELSAKPGPGVQNQQQQNTQGGEYWDKLAEKFSDEFIYDEDTEKIKITGKGLQVLAQEIHGMNMHATKIVSHLEKDRGKAVSKILDGIGEDEEIIKDDVRNYLDNLDIGVKIDDDITTAAMIHGRGKNVHKLREQAKEALEEATGSGRKKVKIESEYIKDDGHIPGSGNQRNTGTKTPTVDQRNRAKLRNMNVKYVMEADERLAKKKEKHDKKNGK